MKKVLKAMTLTAQLAIAIHHGPHAQHPLHEEFHFADRRTVASVSR
jgi:hypothetical protein